jgi:hypothetical protein
MNLCLPNVLNYSCTDRLTSEIRVYSTLEDILPEQWGLSRDGELVKKYSQKLNY